ncbi:TrkH family potassium uptake protein [Geoalkalibacter halelectricus]|uniref:TrkH family potassium uptake protein n=1 Tax=Geoalkalibacter halelectricus TaxID=2847045 RepID=A0ABY5ZM75_9BACT|nr:TrkH family potassium uptake protein [Geoalkalibacter halelectricus]MDO3378445.1 TrkH family potassium uptake protein [Geoalkalibacter halelectricus]UWZ80235.1 TrkH family potassium uptake protein [Geoalkalibacter halelectricus]
MSPAGFSLRGRELSPGTALIFYYLAAIAVGTLLLALPAASRGAPLSLIDALFTATSAQCVTGLIVVDTGSDLSLFGQLVVLTLIQIGGLGIMTFSVLLFVYLGKRVSLRGRWIINETLMHAPVASLGDLLRPIIIFVLIVEGVGAALLALVFVPDLGWAQGIYYALFHSVSAFCNAGFALFPDSLEGYAAHPLANLTFMMLITLGGLGFLVVRDLLSRIRAAEGRRRRLSLHTRLVLWVSAVLTLGGALLIFFLELDNSLRERTAAEGLWIALFQSVTARTAGFNTLDLNLFHPATLMLMLFLMLIGASPGSCGGGLKTTSLAVLFATLLSRLRGSPHTSIFHRTIPEEQVTKALSLILLALLLLGTSIFFLLAVQMPTLAPNAQGEGFLLYTFEAVSAFATVGLSLGATGQLGDAGKLIIIVLMFIGRVGLLTVAFAIVRRRRQKPLRYGEENIMIG